jgi:hypothetical protein
LFEYTRNACFIRDVDANIAATSPGSYDFMLLSESSVDGAANSAGSSYQ